jgi:hypothetical protein
LPKVLDDKRARRDLSSQYPDLAEEDVKSITGNLLGVGKRVKETNPRVKHSRQMGRQVIEAVQRLKVKKNKTDAEEQLLKCAKTKPSADYIKRRQGRE